MEIRDKVAFVTGAGSGLGRATALSLAAAGARVAALDLDRKAAQRAVDQMAGQGLAVEIDVAEEESVAGAIGAVTDAFGTVHICVNAAGIAPAGKVISRGRPLPLADFRRVIDINLIGLFDVVRHCAEHMATNDPGPDGERGVFVNVSSGAAWQGQKGQAGYAASKAGVIGLTLPLARDLADHGIRVVTIAPGIFETGMSAGFPETVRAALQQLLLYPSRFGAPEEFAQLVNHIVTNRYLNATTLSLDGGARMI